tara:strand:- start:33 stop:572 length:540 start_codon:yes stop_codon:yes gene_type:complete
MSKVNLICSVCNQSFLRDKKEFNRSQKFGRPSYCSRICSGKANQKSLGEHLGVGNNDNLITRKPDEYTPFRYFLRAIKRREYLKGKSNIDLEYLKQLWEEQSGICPFTEWKLTLPAGSSVRKDKTVYRASLDRIDNSKGYIKGNLRYVSIMANYCRNEFSDEEVKLFCEAVTSTKKVDT